MQSRNQTQIVDSIDSNIKEICRFFCLNADNVDTDNRYSTILTFILELSEIKQNFFDELESVQDTYKSHQRRSSDFDIDNHHIFKRAIENIIKNQRINEFQRKIEYYAKQIRSGSQTFTAFEDTVPAEQKPSIRELQERIIRQDEDAKSTLGEIMCQPTFRDVYVLQNGFIVAEAIEKKIGGDHDSIDEARRESSRRLSQFVKQRFPGCVSLAIRGDDLCSHRSLMSGTLIAARRLIESESDEAKARDLLNTLRQLADEFMQAPDVSENFRAHYNAFMTLLDNIENRSTRLIDLVIQANCDFHAKVSVVDLFNLATTDLAEFIAKKGMFSAARFFLQLNGQDVPTEESINEHITQSQSPEWRSGLAFGNFERDAFCRILNIKNTNVNLELDNFVSRKDNDNIEAAIITPENVEGQIPITVFNTTHVTLVLTSEDLAIIEQELLDAQRHHHELREVDFQQNHSDAEETKTDPVITYRGTSTQQKLQTFPKPALRNSPDYELWHSIDILCRDISENTSSNPKAEQLILVAELCDNAAFTQCKDFFAARTPSDTLIQEATQYIYDSVKRKELREHEGKELEDLRQKIYEAAQKIQKQEKAKADKPTLETVPTSTRAPEETSNAANPKSSNIQKSPEVKGDKSTTVQGTQADSAKSQTPAKATQPVSASKARKPLPIPEQKLSATNRTPQDPGVLEEKNSSPPASPRSRVGANGSSSIVQNPTANTDQNFTTYAGLRNVVIHLRKNIELKVERSCYTSAGDQAKLRAFEKILSEINQKTVDNNSVIDEASRDTLVNNIADACKMQRDFFHFFKTTTSSEDLQTIAEKLGYHLPTKK